MVGVPVTLNFEGDQNHKTWCGGIASIFGFGFIALFFITTFLNYLTFSQVTQQTLEIYIEPY